jgi:mannosyl-oligosaccharide alpha-1,2-mannosidase
MAHGACAQVFLDKAVELADKLLPAFDTPTGLPMKSINLGTGALSKDRIVLLAEVGTVQVGAYSFICLFHTGHTYLSV